VAVLKGTATHRHTPTQNRTAHGILLVFRAFVWYNRIVEYQKRQMLHVLHSAVLQHNMKEECIQVAGSILDR